MMFHQADKADDEDYGSLNNSMATGVPDLLWFDEGKDLSERRC